MEPIQLGSLEHLGTQTLRHETKLNTKTKAHLVLKLIRFNAPILRDEASVKSFECSSITRQIRYKRRNIGNDSTTSNGTSAKPGALFLFDNFVSQRK